MNLSKKPNILSVSWLILWSAVFMYFSSFSSSFGFWALDSKSFLQLLWVIALKMLWLRRSLFLLFYLFLFEKGLRHLWRAVAHFSRRFAFIPSLRVSFLTFYSLKSRDVFQCGPYMFDWVWDTWLISRYIEQHHEVANSFF